MVQEARKKGVLEEDYPNYEDFIDAVEFVGKTEESDPVPHSPKSQAPPPTPMGDTIIRAINIALLSFCLGYLFGTLGF
jgi:hypothetical protein